MCEAKKKIEQLVEQLDKNAEYRIHLSGCSHVCYKYEMVRLTEKEYIKLIKDISQNQQHLIRIESVRLRKDGLFEMRIRKPIY